jgi:hypothetical protein
MLSSSFDDIRLTATETQKRQLTLNLIRWLRT